MRSSNAIEHHRNWTGVFLISGAVCAFSDIAYAQEQTAELRAQTLFDEARELFQAGHYPAACAKFAESQRLDPKGGTLLNLAICSEKAGKTATAFTQFSQAVAQARRDGRPERVAFAEERLLALRGRLSSLTVTIPPNVRVHGLHVEVDGSALHELSWDAKLPIDPGEHVISARAPGYEQALHRVLVGDKADQHFFSLPPLVPDNGARASAGESEAMNGQARKNWGIFVGSLGVAATATGAAFGVSALSGRSRAEELCRQNRCDEGRSINDTAETHAWVANAAFGLGLVGLSVGAYLYIVPGHAAREPQRSKPHARVGLTPRPGGLSIEGSF